MDRILNAFSRPKLAEKAQYQFARGGTDITGPSIRAAEAIGQQWGNMDSGWREVARGVDPNSVPYSEIEAFCIDLQARNVKRLQFIVKHWRDTKSGGYLLKDERDVYELCANQAQRRVRACILASIPGDVTEAAMDQAEVTLKASADTSPEAMAKLVTAFSAFGVGKEAIEKRIQRRLDTIQPAQVIALRRIYASLRDDMSTPRDWFEVAGAAPGSEPSGAPAAGIEAVKAAASAATRRKAGGAATPAAHAAEAATAAVDPATGEITEISDASAAANLYFITQLRERIGGADQVDVLAMIRDDVLTLPDGSQKAALLQEIDFRVLDMAPKA